MGKKTAIKRLREAESQSIRTKKSNTKGGAGLSRKQRQQLEDYGTLDALESQFTENGEEGIAANDEKSWTFNAKGELIESTEDQEEETLTKEEETAQTLQKYSNLPILNASQSLLNPLEGLNSKLNKNQKQKSSLSKLMGQFKKSSKRDLLNLSTTKQKAAILKKERETGENERVKKEKANGAKLTEDFIDHMNDENLTKDMSAQANGNTDGDFEDAKEDNDEMETDGEEDIDAETTNEDPFFKHFADNSYSVEHLEVLSTLAKQKKWQVNPLESELSETCGNLVRLSVEEDDYKVNFNSEKCKKYDSLDDWFIRNKIQPGWAKYNKKILEENRLNSKSELFTPLQSQLLNQLVQYQDILYPHRTLENTEEIRSTYLLHCLNHAIKVRKEITNNNSKLIMARKEGKPLDDIRDGSYVRPKVLILVPFRSAAYKVIKFFIDIIGAEVENKSRFMQEFYLSPEEDRINKNKPADFIEAFSGHNDDCFRLGLKLTKGSFKLYSNFYDSDILVASPLGLRLIIGNPGDKKRDHDFLSSIEILYMDQVEHMLMQNWDHVTHVFNHLNLVPENPHDCDFSRVKQYVLNDKLPTLRQNLFLSSFLSPELLNLFNNYSLNIAGKIKYKLDYKDQLAKVRTSTKQIFHKVRCANYKDADNLRFKYFTETLLPYLNKNIAELNHTLIFIPSYFDFTRIRNYLDSQDIEFGILNEYSTVSDSSHDRDYFKQGIHHFLLYTERAHFFRRYHLKGVQRIIFYGLPDNTNYYSELINMVDIPEELKLIHNDIKQSTYPYFSLSLVTQFDQLKWERVIGSSRIEGAMKGKRDILTFL